MELPPKLGGVLGVEVKIERLYREDLKLQHIGGYRGIK